MKEALTFLPFEFFESPKYSWVRLEANGYKSEVFEDATDGEWEGDGYDWTTLARHILQKLPEIKNKVLFDSESSYFIAYSINKKVLLEFLSSFQAIIESEGEMYNQLKDCYFRSNCGK